MGPIDLSERVTAVGMHHAGAVDNGVALRDRICVAALACVARWGITKTTLEDVAREAGCGRATIYRTFQGGKHHVMGAAFGRELARFRDEIDGAVAAATRDDPDDLESVLVAGVVTATRFLRDHQALSYLFAHEPDVVLPWVGFHRLDHVFDVVHGVAAPHLHRFVPEPGATRRATEWLTRVVLSYLLNPAPGRDLGDPADARRLLTAYVIPGIRARTAPMEEQCPAT